MGGEEGVMFKCILMKEKFKIKIKIVVQFDFLRDIIVLFEVIFVLLKILKVYDLNIYFYINKVV